MSEEEKKAIELIQQKSNDYLFYIQCGVSIDKAIVTLLNLIEKQQNRIDELEKSLIDEDLKHRDKINKAIDKLKEDIKNNIKKAGSYVRDEATVEQERAIAKFEEANEILKILEE